METPVEQAKLLIVETSGRVGQVAVARGAQLFPVRRLDEARRHARDLAPTVAELLASQGWEARDLNAVIVSTGPGSYTGLRVGVMSAKALAYATGCQLIGIPTFAALATQALQEVTLVDVLADAQQDKVYVQQFRRPASGVEWSAASELTILPTQKWLERRGDEAWVTGPGLRVLGDRLSAVERVVAAEAWDPLPESLLRIGLERYCAGRLDDMWTLEPLYARPSSAEEKRGGE